jgi:hypothetical protein
MWGKAKAGCFRWFIFSIWLFLGLALILAAVGCTKHGRNCSVAIDQVVNKSPNPVSPFRERGETGIGI